MLERENTKRQVAQRLAAVRRERGISEEQAARDIGVSHRQYQRWSRRENLPSPLYRTKIQKWGVELEDLFPEERNGNGLVIDLLEEMNVKLDALLKKDP